MIDFFSFVASVQNNTLPQDSSIFCLVGTFPSYFFSHIFAQMEASGAASVQKILCDQEDLAVVTGKLQTTFLGQTCVYWIFGIELLPPSGAKQLLQYLALYEGPHTLILMLDEQQAKQFAKKSTHIAIPAALVGKQLEKCIELLYPGQAQALRSKLQASTLSREQYTLDMITMLLSYVRLIGGSIDEFANDWYPKLVANDSSLFTLSTYLFAQQKREFFQLWHALQHDYPAQFWIAFFSEQLLKAYGYILYTRQNNHIAAKKIGYRLPFAFMRTDWKRYTPAKLVQFHDALYRMDFHIKNGGTEQFDLFFAQFFL